MGSVRRPSLGRTGMGKARRSRPFAGSRDSTYRGPINEFGYHCVPHGKKAEAMKRLAIFVITLVTLAVPALNVSAQDWSPERLEQRILERRAVDAVIWGMPIVSLDALRQAYFRDGNAKYGDIIWWPKGSTWKNQSLTANMTLRYIYMFA